MSDKGAFRALTASAVLLGCLLAGCSEDAPEPEPLPSPSSSSAPSAGPPESVSPSPDREPPTMPPEARGTSRAAAEAFARHYVDLINYAMHSGDTSPMRRAAQRACSGCNVIAEAIDDVYGGSGRVVGGDWLVRSVTSTGTSDTLPLVRMRLLITRQMVYDSPSARPSTSTPSRGRLEILLVDRAHHWKTKQLDAFE